MEKEPKYTNRLINASSPYLLQHAHNPVDWQEWGETAWEQARRENKLVLVSIGYASCHWCHVMEHESFENEDTAALMNEYFVCIKVDREERPDVDQIYMDAVQLMSGRGGWPLNMFCLPDGRPVHGGTYFPTMQWNQLLIQLQDLYRTKPEEAREYAAKLLEGIQNMDQLHHPGTLKFSPHILKEAYEKWSHQFDLREGGNARTPKFPLPNNFIFLLDYGILHQDQQALDFVHLTLTSMARGGIYDQLGGGFSRYSVDAFWLVPHFEKMLYDNGQLLTLYARAYRHFQTPLFREVCLQTIAFMESEWKNPEGLYYSSYDADSEGEEGKYYVWSYEELEEYLGPDCELFASYYRCTREGNWEHGRNILHCRMSPLEFAALNHQDSAEVISLLQRCSEKLENTRRNRVKPALDDKLILSWNALALEGLCETAIALNDTEIRSRALALAQAIVTHLRTPEGTYFRIRKNGRNSIPAFLEDYASLMNGLLAVYQLDPNPFWLDEVSLLTRHVQEEFMDKNDGLFYFTPSSGESLIIRKKDLGDDVISSGNSMLAAAFQKLDMYRPELGLTKVHENMLEFISPQFAQFPSWYAGWGSALTAHIHEIPQLSCSPDKEAVLSEWLTQHYVPLLLLHPYGDQFETTIREGLFQLCLGRRCFLPEASPEEAFGNMKA